MKACSRALINRVSPHPSHLITSTAAWLYLLSVVPATIDLAVLLVVEIDEVHEKLVAVLTGEAGGVPASVFPSALREHSHLTDVQNTLASLTYLQRKLWTLSLAIGYIFKRRTP